MGDYVRLEPGSGGDAGLATIRLDRPPMNTLDAQAQEELRAAAQEATARADIRAVVIYGGTKVFAAGADVREMAAMSYLDMVDRVYGLQSAFTAVARIPKPVVAAVTGYALGGGLELALAADFRICGDNARLAVPEILLGIIPGAGGTQRLPRLVGPARAKDLIFTGRYVAADEALAIGLVDRVVAPDDVYAEALGMARRFTSAAPYALRAAKQAVDEGMDLSLDSGLALERTLFSGLFATEDRAIGMNTFVESGPGKAEFVGR